MKSVIQNSKVITSGDVQEDDDYIACGDLRFPKSIFKGCYVVDGAPQGVSPHGWLYLDGHFVKGQSPITEDLIKDVTELTQRRLDNFARTRNYDSILSACTYATSAVPKFQAEGQYCVQMRDATWAALYQMLADIESGSMKMPSDFDEMEALLPTLTWPT